MSTNHNDVLQCAVELARSVGDLDALARQPSIPVMGHGLVRTFLENSAGADAIKAHLPQLRRSEPVRHADVSGTSWSDVLLKIAGHQRGAILETTDLDTGALRQVLDKKCDLNDVVTDGVIIQRWTSIMQRLAKRIAPVDAEYLVAAVECEFLASESVESVADDQPAEPPGQTAADDPAEPIAESHQPAEAEPKKPKRSTQKGEADRKLRAALTKHHKYGHGGCLNTEPIGNNELAKKADGGKSSASSASRFFKRWFGGHSKYTATCRDVVALTRVLKQMNDDYRPAELRQLLDDGHALADVDPEMQRRLRDVMGEK